VYVCVYVCEKSRDIVCVYVCVWEREREEKKEWMWVHVHVSVKERYKERERVCVCVCACALFLRVQRPIVKKKVEGENFPVISSLFGDWGPWWLRTGRKELCYFQNKVNVNNFPTGKKVTFAFFCTWELINSGKKHEHN
jgi:hypothetical protein